MTTMVEFIKARVNQDERDIREFEEFVAQTEMEMVERDGLSRPMREVRFHRALLEAAVEVLGDGGAEGNWADLVLTHMASVWADHPDYDPSWGVGVPGSDPQASHGSQAPSTPERPGDGDSVVIERIKDDLPVETWQQVILGSEILHGTETPVTRLMKAYAKALKEQT